ncbi:conidial pigment polyketide synthase [Fusarium longipes]|uniref:Conidial pigment polyketide synthase n=1 Tax=Fusarium longipes TaxID=694270 RepID=A0A395RX84_9HYPO|nr:conidial pigment polyketide synthase [Fusarium longipes]
MAPHNDTHELLDDTTHHSQANSLICLTITAFKKPSLSDEEYRHHMTKVHAKLVSPLMEEYGIVRYTMTHNTKETRPMLHQLYDPQFSKLSDYDCIVQFVFKDILDFQRMKADPRFLEKVAPDHVNFADTKRSTMTVGYFEEFVNNGKVVAKG